jgi:phosphoglycolate phosphatase
MCTQLSDELSLTYVVIPEANHSLETGDVAVDIANLQRVMEMVDKLL